MYIDRKKTFGGSKSGLRGQNTRHTLKFDAELLVEFAYLNINCGLFGQVRWYPDLQEATCKNIRLWMGKVAESEEIVSLWTANDPPEEKVIPPECL